MRAERIDRLLSRLGYGSRKDVRNWIRKGRIEVAGKPATDPALKARPDQVLLDGEKLDHPFGLTLIYHKPAGLVCSHNDHGPLIYDDFPERWRRRRPPLSSVGRLDKDTSGLLILTDDGALNHMLADPGKRIAKTYRVATREPLDASLVERFAAGDLMLKGDRRPCLPAKLKIIDDHHASLTLYEGRYHQVRRMFAALGNHVEALCRTHIGRLDLEQTHLQPGEYQFVSPDELWAMIIGSSSARLRRPLPDPSQSSSS